jgi:hypothetical protein
MLMTLFLEDLGVQTGFRAEPLAAVYPRVDFVSRVAMTAPSIHRDYTNRGQKNEMQGASIIACVKSYRKWRKLHNEVHNLYTT